MMALDPRFASSPEFAKYMEAQASAQKAAEAQKTQKAAQQAAAQKAQTDNWKAMSAKIAEQRAAAAEKAKIRNDAVSSLAGQLAQQAAGYGVNWKGNKEAGFHQKQVADLLYGQGITSLDQVVYSKDGRYLMNKDTGQNLKWYKQDKNAKKGNPLKNEGQIGWSAKGKGRTDYEVQKDAQGNPVFFPKWKSNAPKGIGGLLIKVAPAVAGAFFGPAGAAAASGLISAASGDSFGNVLKNAAISGGTAYLGNKANIATQGALKGLNPNLVKALGMGAQGATQSGVAGLARGNFDLKDVLISGLASGAAGGIQSLLSPQALPSGQAGPPTPGLVNTGYSGLDRAIASTAGGAAKGVISGQDVGSALVNSAANAGGQFVGNQMAGLVPETGNKLLDGFLRNAAKNLSSSAVKGVVSGTANARPRSPISPSRSGGISQLPMRQQVRYQMPGAPRLSFV
jgi:hypothetical protein